MGNLLRGYNSFVDSNIYDHFRHAAKLVPYKWLVNYHFKAIVWINGLFANVPFRLILMLLKLIFEVLEIKEMISKTALIGYYICWWQFHQGVDWCNSLGRGRHWFRQWPINFLLLNQSLYADNWTFKIKLQCNFNQHNVTSFHGNSLLL